MKSWYNLVDRNGDAQKEHVCPVRPLRLDARLEFYHMEEGRGWDPEKRCHRCDTLQDRLELRQ